MPKRTDIQSIMIIGAGPIIIGQACEFDYSGAQACKALKKEGFKVILVNSNPATIMTDPTLADKTYIEPIEWQSIAKIIEKERPDAILPTMGGQTGLNTALTLAKEGVLEKYGVELIGASREAIDKAEDRELFDKTMKSIGIDTPTSGIAHSMDDAFAVQKEIGFPCIIRPSFTLGGTGGGVAYNIQEFEEICKKGLDLSPTNELLIDESLIGWKEFELEVVRDRNDNCIIICSIENIDPMGVHTGDSITIAPAQTLTDKEYQVLRDLSFKILREIGVETGGSNVQFAVNPSTGKVVVIEMNPRVSRSSALASKATGFPIAKVAALLSVGFTLDELKNDITQGLTPASFEPSIDYVVTKIPKFAFEKFPQANSRLTTQMKSVGEVMSIGRTFQESFQKALQSMEEGLYGFESILDSEKNQNETLQYELTFPGPSRMLYLADAMRLGWDDEKLHKLTGIDPWFLFQFRDLINEELNLEGLRIDQIEKEKLLALKQNKLCWFAWIASSILYLYVMYQAGLYMESLLQVFYLCMGFYGLSQWSKTINNNQNTYVDLWSIGNHIFAISLVIVLSFLSGTLLSNFSNAALPFIDAFTTWGAIVASYMVAKKILENWIYWFVIDFISVFIFASRGLYFTSALFVTYLVIIYFGYKSWSKIRLNQNESIA